MVIYVSKGSSGYHSGLWAALHVVEYSSITSIALVSPMQELQLTKNVRLTARLEPADAIPMLSWESSDTSVAAVDKDRTVTAAALGTATI